MYAVPCRRSASDAGFARAGAADASRSPAAKIAVAGITRRIHRSYAPCAACARLRLLHTIRPLMDKTGIHPGGEHAHVHADALPHEHHEELGFWRKYVFSTDHKVIGIQY